MCNNEPVMYSGIHLFNMVLNRHLQQKTDPTYQLNLFSKNSPLSYCLQKVIFRPFSCLRHGLNHHLVETAKPCYEYQYITLPISHSVFIYLGLWGGGG